MQTGVEVQSGGPGRLTTALGALAFLLLAATTYLALFYAPTDRIQGDAQRIFYFHVPIAWVGFLAVGVVGGASILYLWRRSEVWDRIARASAEIGVVFTTLMLITGSIWAKPIWNTWWQWDPKLTTSLILWLVYVGYLMVRSYITDTRQAARAAAVVGIVGTLDVPIIYKAADWWRAIHPSAVVSTDGAKMPGEMVQVLLLSLVAFTLLYVFLMLVRVQAESLRDEAAALSPSWQEV